MKKLSRWHLFNIHLHFLHRWWRIVQFEFCEMKKYSLISYIHSIVYCGVKTGCIQNSSIKYGFFVAQILTKIAKIPFRWVLKKITLYWICKTKFEPSDYHSTCWFLYDRRWGICQNQSLCLVRQNSAVCVVVMQMSWRSRLIRSDQLRSSLSNWSFVEVSGDIQR